MPSSSRLYLASAKVYILHSNLFGAGISSTSLRLLIRKQNKCRHPVYMCQSVFLQGSCRVQTDFTTSMISFVFFSAGRGGKVVCTFLSLNLSREREQSSNIPPEPIRSRNYTNAITRHRFNLISRHVVRKCTPCYLYLTSSSFLIRECSHYRHPLTA